MRSWTGTCSVPTAASWSSVPPSEALCRPTSSNNNTSNKTASDTEREFLAWASHLTLCWDSHDGGGPYDSGKEACLLPCWVSVAAGSNWICMCLWMKMVGKDHLTERMHGKDLVSKWKVWKGCWKEDNTLKIDFVFVQTLLLLAKNWMWCITSSSAEATSGRKEVSIHILIKSIIDSQAASGLCYHWQLPGLVGMTFVPPW